MLNRATVIGITIALAAAVLVALLTHFPMGPRASQAGFADPSISIEELHGQVDHGKLPVHSIPEP